MQILNAYSCLSKGGSGDREQNGFAGDLGCRYARITTAPVSPCVCTVLADTLRFDESSDLKGRQQRSAARCGSSRLRPVGIIRIISANLFPGARVLLLTSFVLNYSSSAHGEVPRRAEKVERRLEERQSLKDGALLPSGAPLANPWPQVSSELSCAQGLGELQSLQ